MGGRRGRRANWLHGIGRDVEKCFQRESWRAAEINEGSKRKKDAI